MTKKATTHKHHHHRLGIGAVVSFQSKYIHPHAVRDKYFPDQPSGHRLEDAIVVGREMKAIKHNETKCVIVHHEDLKRSDGTYVEFWCAESHVKVRKEGDPDKFFEEGSLSKDNGEGSEKETEEDDKFPQDDDDIEKQIERAHHQDTHGGRRSSAITLLDPSGFDDPLRPRHGRDLMWANVNMTVTSRKGDEKGKKILDGVWGEVPTKQVTAIMGPSGSGKTSLLNILAGRVSSHGNIKIDADIRLNNYSVDPSKIEVRNKIAYVAQDDSLQVTATPREAIRFSAKLRLPRTMTDEALDNLTSIMLDELGLQCCADVIVGGALLKGISGGERKRTSVGVELVTHPALVFLDEPTSGLDSYNALQLCQLLKKVANAGSSVLFTIHQPSSEIFSSFDQLILLNMGRVMYRGLIPDIPNYFAERKFPVPKHHNPADHIMTVALTNSIETLEAAGFFLKDDRVIPEPFLPEETEDKDALGITKKGHHADQEPPPGVAAQTKCLFDREIKNFFRNTHALRVRTVMTMVISVFIGSIFYKVAEKDFSQFINAQSTFGALLMALLANVFSTVLPSLLAFPEERPVFLREYSTNHYSVVSYVLSRLTMELVVTGVQVTLSTVITFFMVGFTLPYWQMWTAVYLLALAIAAMSIMIGSAVENPSTALEFLPFIFMPQILFSGFFVPPELIPNWLAWISYICPLTYGVRIILAGEFGDGRCDNVTSEVNACDQILTNADVDTNDVWWYYLVLLGLFCFFRLLALFLLKQKASKFY